MPSFPLDDGENAAVTLAGNLDAVFFLCDRLIQLGLIHVLFGNTRLVTASVLLSMLVRTEQLLIVDTYPLLDTISVNHLACCFSSGLERLKGPTSASLSDVISDSVEIATAELRSNSTMSSRTKIETL